MWDTLPSWAQSLVNRHIFYKVIEAHCSLKGSVWSRNFGKHLSSSHYHSKPRIVLWPKAGVFTVKQCSSESNMGTYGMFCPREKSLTSYRELMLLARMNRKHVSLLWCVRSGRAPIHWAGDPHCGLTGMGCGLVYNEIGGGSSVCCPGERPSGS